MDTTTTEAPAPRRPASPACIFAAPGPIFIQTADYELVNLATRSILTHQPEGRDYWNVVDDKGTAVASFLKYAEATELLRAIADAVKAGETIISVDELLQEVNA